MGKSRTKQVKKASLKKYEGRLVTNFIVKTKAAISLDPKRVTKAFAQARGRFPGMLRTTFPSDDTAEKNEYKLGEKDSTDPTQPLRSLLLAERELGIAACHPLSSAQQFHTTQELVKVLDGLDLVDPIAIEYADYKFVFEFDYLGNHHRKILDILFKDSCLGQLSKKIGGEPTDFVPGLTIRHPKDVSLRVVFELRPRTGIREIESGKYDGDHIAAVCSVAKVRDFEPGENLAKIHTVLHKECLRIFTASFISAVVEPLDKELGE